MKNKLIILSLAIFFISCGKPVKLNYEQLENQYMQLTPYWEAILENNINTDESARFAVLYKKARNLLEEYKDPSRGVGAGGVADGEDRNDTVILWELRNTLTYASNRTNSIAQSLAEKTLNNL